MLFQQENQNDTRKSNLVGGIATLIYALLLLVALLLVTFKMEVKENEGEGLMINFGNTEEAAPGADMRMNDQIAEARQQEQQIQAKPVEQEQLTQDFEEAPVVQEKKKPTPKPKEEKKVTPTPKPTQAPAEKPREVNRKALFPGRTEGSTATSEGTGQGAGNQGDPAGDPGGSHDGTGTGTSGGSASLAGRSLVGSLPRPDYGVKEQGRVIIEITVDPTGKVVSAAYRSVGSTTQNSSLVSSALKAARQARFNVDDKAAVTQRGTITYNFRLQ